MKQKRKVIVGSVLTVLAVLLIIRIRYVNETAKLSEIRIVPQGQTAEYGGMAYTIVGAELWTYDAFFDEHAGLDDYEDPNCTDEKACVLLVSYRIEKKQKDALLKVDMPIQYAHQYNGIDPFMLQDMNPSLGEGTFATGDILTIPYEIYRINLKGDTWRAINNLDMTYSVILGVYPVKTELQITDVEKKGAW